MTGPTSRRFEADGPFDLAGTVKLQRMWGGFTWIRVDPDGCWYAERTKEGAASVRLTSDGAGVLAEAWGPGAEALLERVPILCGLDGPSLGERLAGWEHPFVQQVARQWGGARVGRSGRVYEHLVSTALAQKVTGANSKRSLRNIAWRWGDAAPGPNEKLRLLPAPRDLAGRAYYDFHGLGIERHRAVLVLRIADRASALERAARMPFAEGRAHLEKLPGIGPWTSGVVLGCALGDPDAVPLADYHLPNWVAWNLAREERADDARMMELLAPFAGARGLVARLTKLGGEGAPRRGPKMTVQDVRRLD